MVGDLLEPEFLVFEGQVAVDQVEVDDALTLINLFVILVVVEPHILHHEIPGLIGSN